MCCRGLQLVAVRDMLLYWLDVDGEVPHFLMVLRHLDLRLFDPPLGVDALPQSVLHRLVHCVPGRGGNTPPEGCHKRDTTKMLAGELLIAGRGDPFNVSFVIFLVDKNSSQILNYREKKKFKHYNTKILLQVWNYRSVVRNLYFFSDHTATDSAAMATCDRDHNDLWLIYSC